MVNSDSPHVSAFSAALDVSGRTVAVLGGDEGAQRVVATLLAAGADVRLLAARYRAVLEGMTPPLDIRSGSWSPALLDGVAAVAVTGDDPGLDGASGGPLPAAIEKAARDAGVVVITPERPDAPLRAITESLRGTVALVGGGPGDDGLLTVRGRELLLAADVVVADRLAPQQVLGELSTNVEIVDAAKIPYGRQMAQDAINEVLVDRARAGKFVVRLKGGDNFLFGRGYEEALACADAGVPCAVVPGVTSAFAAPALGGVPVTHRGVTHEVTVISGHVPPGHAASLVDWRATARMRGTLVLLMAVKNAPAIAEALLDGGRDGDTPVTIIESASLDAQRRIDATLGTLAADMAAAEVAPPAIIVVGAVAALPRALSDSILRDAGA